MGKPTTKVCGLYSDLMKARATLIDAEAKLREALRAEIGNVLVREGDRRYLQTAAESYEVLRDYFHQDDKGRPCLILVCRVEGKETDVPFYGSAIGLM